MPETCDAIIIGAGVIGARAAFEMSKAGYRVLSSDKTGGAGRGSTAGSCAIIRLCYSKVESCAVSRESRFHWKDPAGDLGASDPRGMVDHRDDGALVMKCTDHGYAECAAELKDAIHFPCGGHVADPTMFRSGKIGMDCSIGLFSRNRAVNPDSSLSVPG